MTGIGASMQKIFHMCLDPSLYLKDPHFDLPVGLTSGIYDQLMLDFRFERIFGFSVLNETLVS